MSKFIVTFQLKSFYADESHDKTVTSAKTFEAHSLDELFELLDDMDEIDEVDDRDVMNDDSDQEPEEVNPLHTRLH